MFAKHVNGLKWLLLCIIIVCGFAVTGCAEGVKTGPNSFCNYKLQNGELLLGNNNYKAMSFSGYKTAWRDQDNCPSVEELKEDMKILSAMGIKIIRTYNTANFPQAGRVLKAIKELKQDDSEFEMYVMVGAWINCKNAYREGIDHSAEDAEWNLKEIDKAIEFANEYPDIVKIIAVGNEAMVHWQAHWVPPSVILKWVKYLKDARVTGKMPANVLVTTSDNWATFGGLGEYQCDDLISLLKEIDYISLHVYAFHDTVYDNGFKWGVHDYGKELSVAEQCAENIKRTIRHQKGQISLVQDYLDKNGIKKDIHIGETGWATKDDGDYGDKGTCVTDEYKSGLFHKAVRQWTSEDHITCFYFEAFDEPWKNNGGLGSEGFFGLFTVDGKAKYGMWELFDSGTFKGLTRGGKAIEKTYGGDLNALLKDVKPPTKIER